MTRLLQKLGLSSRLSFHDVFSIDDPELLAFVPRPALALLLVFPVSDTYEKFRTSEDQSRPQYEGYGEGEPVVWYKQTIGNACGLIGLLHAVSNGEARNEIGGFVDVSQRPCFPGYVRTPVTLTLTLNISTGPQSDLHKLLHDAIPLKPMERAKLLYDSEALESAHQTAAVTGDSSVPQADDDVDLHYVCFIKSSNGHLWEMDGRRTGPLDRGALPPDADMLSQEALDVGVRSFLKREEQAGGGDLRFSLIALAPSFVD